jgi:5-methylcytosine-specific restriction endonuclease McrA
MRGLTGDKKKKARSKLMRRQKNCWYCECVLTADNRTIEHVVPKVLVSCGANALHNLRLCCKGCNGKRGESLVVPQHTR